MPHNGVVEMRLIPGAADESAAAARSAQADRNYAWWQAHSSEMFGNPAHRGKCVCIAGGELFVADTPGEVMQMALSAHPQDCGKIVHYIPKDKAPRIYAN